MTHWLYFNAVRCIEIREDKERERDSCMSCYLGVYYENLAHWNPNLEVTKLICISISKSSIEWIWI
jgi:hypothetical protein